METRLDVINYWSEVKLAIVREYATAYSTILTARPQLFHIYVDAFAGAGIHISRTTGDFVAGSPLNALLVEPPFRKYHFIDLDGQKADLLRNLTRGRSNVTVYEEDCNEVLLDRLLPQIKYEAYRRALCLLDPYGLHLKWDVIRKAGEMGTVEIFLNFPLADMNRNVLWHKPQKVRPDQVARMNAFWGDGSWRQAAYHTTKDLFGEEQTQRTGHESVVRAFQKRLKQQAGFGYVPDPMPMRNSRGSAVYYLFIAAQKPVAAHIVTDIFTKYRQRGLR